MSYKGNSDEVNPYIRKVYMVRIVYDVMIWFALISLLVSMVWFNHRHLRIRSKSIYYCCIFAICSVIISILFLLFNYPSIWKDQIAWTTRIGAFGWLILLLYSVQHVHIPNIIFTSLLLLLLITAWVNISVQLLSSMFYSADIIADIVLVIPHTIIFIAIADWEWLIVHEITSVFRWKPTTTTTTTTTTTNTTTTTKTNTMESEISADVYNDGFQSNLLPLRRDMCVDAYTPEMRFGRTHSFLYILMRRWGGMYLLLAIVRLMYELGGLLPAYLLRTLVDNLVQAQSGSTKNGTGDFQTSAVVLFLIILCTLVVTFLRVHYNMKLKKIAVYNRGLLTMELFRCTLNRRKYQIENKTQGEIMNHLTVDIQRVSDAVQTINDLWALPLQLIFALYLLYIQVSFAFLAGVVVTLLLIPVNALLAKRIKHVQTNLMQENDERVLTITEIVNNILYVKMCGWSHLVQGWVKIPREHYMKYLTWLKYLDALCVFFWATTPTLVSLFTFITFIWMGGHLTTGKAVTALALFGSLIMPLNAYPWVINGFMEAYVSWKRLQPFLTIKLNDRTLTSMRCSLKDRSNIKDYRKKEEEDGQLGRIYKVGERQPLLLEKDIADNSYQVQQSYSKSFQLFEETNNDFLVNIKESGVICTVSVKDTSFKDDFILRIPKFQASRGQLIAIVGRSGSGKSTFLNSIAGEVMITSTSASTDVISITPTSIAYVEQQPFLISGTIRENILFGLSYDSSRYEAVLHAVALKEDLNYCFHPDGDNSPVGDRGGLLSGGQKVRVALARALYADKEVYLIDDLLGCLDATVAHHIIIEAFVAAAKRGSCVIVVTHNEELIQQADAVYICNEGHILYTNQYYDTIGSSLKSIQKKKSDSMIIGCTIKKKNVQIEEEEEEEEEANINIKREKDKINVKKVENEVLDRIVSKPILETSERGSLSWDTVTCYISRIGWKLTGFIVISVIAMQLSRNLSDQYVVVWSKDGKSNTTMFLRVLGLLAVLNSLLALVRGFCFAIGGLKAAERIHNELLYHVISATFAFFSNTPPGRIITRMTRDISTIDDSLPFITNILLAQTFLFIGSLIIILVNSSVVMMFLLLPLLLSYYHIQRPYRIFSRELRRLEGAADAPLLDTLRDSIDGGVLIRSLGREAVESQLRRAKESLELILRIQYNTLLLNAWFILRLELVGILLLIFVGSVALLGHGSTHAPLLGLALAYVQPLTSYVNGLLGALISTEKELVSVERVRQYFQLPNEEGNGKNMVCLFPKTPWPSVGVIHFTKVSMRYDLSTRQVLQELTFHVEAGEKVAIVGRTGAGKSSIFAALLRLVNLDNGSITIDGIDVGKIPLEFLRTSIGILPQQPFIFHGTLRKNLDPLNLYTDDKIHTVMNSVGLGEYSMDYDIVNSESISGGQRHQIAVARVLLQQSRILLLDEPTSQSSVEAESLLWKMLDAHLNRTTLLCITHKLTHIDFFDRVIVINDGHVVNSGTPTQLRQNHSWPFSLNLNTSHIL
ncbi:multidrug resistance-associated protein [Trypanosoma theileri]|uniref:ABC-type xenobiotic transporter n=1 Tax=Trypanosoma theileri TaxID=67003 RepID=A0A1X0PAJ0_9TRYP|nr:multidrug resistance-associated protein [Trypanosoma theileri]ORC93599.1 multidrug resistance-associated protein [Trypanosoma theileri]